MKVTKKLTEAQKEEIETLAYNELDESVYLDYLDNLGCDDFSDFDEAYCGEFPSDEDFAQNLAEDIGAIDPKASWPNNCIDWEYAARELMYDYYELNGHYFRNI